MSVTADDEGRPLRPDAATIWTRRTFLAGVGFAGAAAAWRFLVQPFALGIGDQATAFEELLRGAISRLLIPTEPGKEFLARRPGTSQEILIQNLFARFGGVQSLPEGENAIFRVLGHWVREDIRAGRIETVNSWKFTETEYQLAALRYLLGATSGGKSATGSLSPILLSRISEWGPQSTPSGTAFNRQPDDSSALWFRTEKALTGLSVRLGDADLITTPQPGLITAKLSSVEAARFVLSAGSYPVQLVVRELGAAQLVGFFHVFPREQSERFETWPLDLSDYLTAEMGTVADWGPRETPVGLAFNPQPGGQSALWVRFQGNLNPGVFLALAGFPLLTIRSPDTLTAAVFPALANRLLATSGTLAFQLIDPADRLYQELGMFQVRLTA